MEPTENDSKAAGAPSALNVGLGVARSFPEEWILKSDKQKTLEKNGCVFIGQEWLDNHEIDLDKPCYCQRPNKTPNVKMSGPEGGLPPKGRARP